MAVAKRCLANIDESSGAARPITAVWRVLFNCFGDQMKKLWRADFTIHDNVVLALCVSTMVVVICISGWFAMKQKTMDQDVLRSCSGETSHRSNEVLDNDPALPSKHKIFLSHSGVQKEFVDQLCKALEDEFYYPFFDRRHDSLPKGEQFPKLIVQAAKQCEMLIVVVSDEYFMSKWPMIELSAFVQAHKLNCESKSSTSGPKILPLFYGLSAKDLEDAKLQRKWFRRWKTLAKADPKNRIIVSDWKYAFDVLGSFNGLPYDRNLKEVVAYKEEIVSCVFKSISPDIRWDDSHVQGKSNICQVIGKKIEEIGVSTQYKIKVVGLYGVGGIGKTMTCKILRNEFSQEYKGRVCHIEFPSDPWNDSKEFFQKLLQDLTRKRKDVIKHLDEGECKGILCRSLFKQRIFLAIDNVSDIHQSIELAKTILKLPFHMDSLVVVTTRSQNLLERLGMKGGAYLEMPDLGEVDAIRLFLQNAICGKEFVEDEENVDIMTCVKRCYFSKGVGQGHHYHPLALKSLGRQLGCHGENSSLWVKHLPHERAFGSFSEGDPVFDILRSGFKSLREKDQTLFMDVGFFLYSMISTTLLSRLYTLHERDEDKIIQRLEELKRKGLVQLVDLSFGRVSMHDLYLELSKLEAKGSFDKSTDLKERMWVFLESNDLGVLERKPNGRCWDKLIRLFIKHVSMSPNKHGRGGEIGSLKGIKWKYFCNVEVLQLQTQDVHGDHLEQGALNLEGLTSLRILELFGVRYKDGIKGLGKLKKLTHFKWGLSTLADVVPIGIVGQLPSFLEVLDISGLVAFKSNALVQCHYLVKLNLSWVEVPLLDLRKCSFLESVHLSRIPNLHTLYMYQSSCLQSLTIWSCKDLAEIPGIDHLIGLQTLDLDVNSKYKVSNLLALTKLEDLYLYSLERSKACSKGFIPCQVQQLYWNLSNSSEGLNLNGFNQLKYLDLSGSNGLTSLAKLGDLPALQVLNLKGCKDLLQLPNLSKSTNLQKLCLVGCFAFELHDKDIQMLLKLPLLEPLSFEDDHHSKGQSFKLDLHRRKVLVHLSLMVYEDNFGEDWEPGEWKELDLDAPPILIGNLGPFLIEEDLDFSDLDFSDLDSLDLDSLDLDWF